MNSAVFINKPSSFMEVTVFILLTQKYVSEEWEQIQKVSFKSKVAGSNSAALSFP